MIARRLVSMIVLLFFVSFLVFALVLFVPGDPATTLAGGERASPEAIAEVRAELGLEDNFIVRYARWFGGAVTMDLGDSLLESGPDGRSVSAQIAERLPVTIGLALAAMGFAVFIGIPAGILAALRPDSRLDRFLMVGTAVGVAMPAYWVAMLLVVGLAVKLQLFPPFGYVPLSESVLGWFEHITLPAVALGAAAAASIARQLRASLVDVMSAPYIRTAWAKGAGVTRVVAKHALKNAAIPTVTVIALQFSYLLGGTVIIETMFGIPGLGSYLVRAVLGGDFPVVQGVTLVFVVVSVTINLLLDIAYGVLNPKVRVH